MQLLINTEALQIANSRKSGVLSNLIFQKSNLLRRQSCSSTAIKLRTICLLAARPCCLPMLHTPQRLEVALL